MSTTDKTIFGDTDGTSSLEVTTSPDVLLNKYDCDECGFTFYKRELRVRYDGANVCRWCYEDKHPRDK